MKNHLIQLTKKHTQTILLLLIVLFFTKYSAYANTNNNQKTTTGTIENSSILADSYFQINQDQIQIEFGQKNNQDEDIVRFETYPQTTENKTGISNYLPQLASSSTLGLQFKLIDKTNSSDLPQKLKQLELDHTTPNQPATFLGQLWNNVNNFNNQIKNTFSPTKFLNSTPDKLTLNNEKNTTSLLNQTDIDDTDLKYYPIKNGLKEEILIEGTTEEVFDTYLFDLQLDPGVILHRAQSDSPFGLAENTYYFTDEKNNYLAHFLPLIAYDSNGLETENISMNISPAVETLHATSLPKHYTITIIIDKTWLTDTLIQYPITIDPSIIHDTQAEFDAGTLNRLQSTSSDRVELKHHELSANSSTVGLWHMNESTGQVANDTSGNSNSGQIGSSSSSDSQDPTWNTTSQKFGASALTFDGTDDEVKITDNASLKLNKEITVEAWVKGSGGDFSATSRTSSTNYKQDAQIQVVGSKIYLVWRETVGSYNQIVTASMNTDGTGWSATQRTSTATQKYATQFQVVGSKIYYVWYETPGTYQIWTASMNTDGTAWSATQRVNATYQQEYPQLQVVGSKIYYVWHCYTSPTMAQICTASMNTDGTGWSSSQMTSTSYHKRLPQFQVVGSKIYYVWQQLDPSLYQIWTATMNTDGTGWAVTQRTTGGNAKSGPQLQVTKSKIYLTWVGSDGSYSQLWNASMNLDGTNWSVSQLTSGSNDKIIVQFQIIGNKIYYNWLETDGTYDQIWIANINIDGTGWTEKKVTTSAYGKGMPQFQIVGSKQYYVWHERDNDDVRQIWTATYGSNIVSKSDFYGVGIVDNSVQGYTNGGLDYTKNFSQAIDYSNGAMSEGTIDSTNWHHVAATFDGATVNTYIDGNLVGSMSNPMPISTNSTTATDYPLIIGDAFNGSIDEVRVSNRALSPEEIKMDAQFRPAGTYTSSVIDLGTTAPTFNNFSWTESGVRTSSVENDLSTGNLVAQWNFNETSGTTAVSGGSCGASCNGALNSFANTTSQDATPISGWTYENRLKYGSDGDGSLMFDGADDYVSVPHSSSINLGAVGQSYSISFWLNTSSTEYPNYYVSKWTTGTTAYPWKFQNYSLDYSKLSFAIYDATHYVPVVSQKKIADGQWHYIVGVRDTTSDTVKLYVDGNLQHSTTDTTTGSCQNTEELRFMRDYTNDYTTGILESPKIYSRALSADEINSNYQAGNIEFQTRTGSDTTPEDSGWEEWKSTATATETSVQNFNTTLSSIDPDPYTQLLLHGEGVSGSQTIYDSSSNQNSITAYNNAQISSTKYKFGQGSLYFDGTGDYIGLASSDNWKQLGTTWTIDTWLYPTSFHSPYNTIYTWVPTGGWFQFFLDGSGQVKIATNTQNEQTWSGYTVPLNQWSHVAIVSNNSSTTVYINGVTAGTKTVTMPSGTSGMPYIGWDTATGREFVGYMDEFRISKGVARWTANFTPSKYPYNTGTNQISNTIDTSLKNEGTGSERCLIGQPQADVNTVGLWHLEETSGTGAYIKDSSGYGNHGTPTGTTLVNGKSGKARSFNGTSDQIVINSILGLSTTNVTIEGWVNIPSTSLKGAMVKVGDSGGYAIGIGGTTFDNNGNDLIMLFEGPRWIDTNVPVGTGWHYLAMTISSSGTPSAYIDGKFIGTFYGLNANAPNTASYIGGYGSRLLGATIDEIKISNVARTLEEINENYRMGANYHITRSLSSNIDLATTNNKLPIQIASDRPGTSLMLTAGESSYVNNELDANTIGYWPLEENFSSDAMIRECTDVDAVGTACGGGKKFATGLVALPSGCANSVNEPTCSGNDTQTKAWASATGTNEPADSIYDGLFDTNSLYTTNPPTNPAADYCYDLVKSGYSDWHLPAQTQLNTLFAQRATIGGFVANYYWTSSEYNVSAYTNAYLQNMSTGTQTQTTKTSPYYYRCIRQYNSDQYKIKDSGPLNMSGQAVGTDATQGKIGQGRYFNGTSDYIRMEDTNGLFSTNTFALESWVKLDSLPNGGTSYKIAGKIGNDLSGNCGYGYSTSLDDTNKFEITIDPTGCGNSVSSRSTTTPNIGQWYHVVGTYNGTTANIYINGVLENSVNLPPVNIFPAYFLIGNQYSENLNQYTNPFKGTIDEVRLSNVVRSAGDIRQAYEAGLRSHPITIDFGAGLDSANLITGSGDLSFTVDATKKGLPNKGENLFVGDKIIIKENYNGTEYLAQGTITSVNKSTGAVTVASWDSGSTFSSSGQTGYSVNADVFKWQKEIVSIYGSLPGHRDEINKISLRILDGNQGQNVWLDDLKISTPLMTDPTSNTIQSTPNQYFQYRFFATTTDTDPTPGVDDVELDYGTLEITGASTSESYINTNNNSAFNIQCNGATDSTTGNNVDCEASFNQTDWYTVSSATTPLSNQTIQGTPDISSWNGYPSGDGTATIYARAHNTTNDTYSTIRNFSITKDVSRPNVTAITSVAGDSSAPYYDTTNDSSTTVVYTTTADATSCKWDETDLTYGAMANTCTSTSSCALNLAGEEAKTVYMRCVDIASNYSLTSYNLNYTIDATPPAVISITSVDGDTASPFYDISDDGDTPIVYTASADASACKWDTSDITYSSMANTCSSTSNCTLNLTGDGSKTVYFRCTDLAGNSSNTSYQLNYTIAVIRYDEEIPVITSITSVAGDTSSPYYDLTDDSATAIVYTASTDATSCKWDETDLTFGAMANTCTSTSSCTLDLAGEGAKSIYMRCINSAGLTSTSSYNLNYTIDATPPVVTSITSVADDTSSPYYDITDDSSTTIVYTASADATACKWDETDLTYGAMANTCTSTTNCNLDLNGEETKSIYMRCIDSAGLTSNTSYNLNYTIDTIPPAVTDITSVAGDTSSPYYDITDDSATEVIYTASTDATACKWDESDLTYGAMVNTCTSTTNCTLNLPGEGDKTVYMRCIDSAGLASTTSYTLNYNIDATPPTVTSITSVAGDTTAPYYDITDNSSTGVVYTASADATACKWDESDLTYGAMTNTCTSTTNCTLNLPGEGDKTVYMRCIDSAGLTSTTSYTLNYNIDATPPTVTSITSVAGDTTAPYYDGTDNGATSIIYTSSADATTCRWSNTDQTYTAMSNTCTSTNTCTLDLSGKGQKNAYFRCLDTAGNYSDTSYNLTYYIDIEPDIISVDAGPSSSDRTSLTSDTWFSHSETGSDNQLSFSWTDPASPSDDTFYYVLNSTSGNFITNGGEAGVANTTNPYLDNITITEGTNYMHVRTKNGVDSWGTERIFIVKYDKTGPTIDSITSVANDTSSPYIDTTDNNNTLVTYSSSDNFNNVSQCKWSTTNQAFSIMPNTCTDNSHCTLNLSGEGAKTVYMRCKDNLDNEAATSYILNYTIDTTPAEVLSITSVAGDNSSPYYDNTDDSNTAVIYTASSDADSCRWSESDQTYGAMPNTCTDTSHCTLNLSGEGAKTVYMRCRDSVGLDSINSYVLNYFIDSTPPSINSIISVAGDTSAVYYDTTDDDSTPILFTSSDDTAECKWSTTDQNYDTMPNTCSSTGNCTSNLNGQGNKTIFIRCKDNIDNQMTTSQQIDYIIDSIAPFVTNVYSVAGDTEAPYVDTVADNHAIVSYAASSDATTCKWDSLNVNYDTMANTCSSTTNCTLIHNGDGLKTIFFRCIDTAGNKSTNSYQLDYEVDENIGGGGMRTEESSSKPSDTVNLFITLTPDITVPAVNGSIKIRLAQEYDLSSLTINSVYASGGGVTWTNDEIITGNGIRIAQTTPWWIEKTYASGENSIVFPFTGDLSNGGGMLTFTISNLYNPSNVGSYSVSYSIYGNPNGFGNPLEIGDGVVHINHVVIVTATVPSYLSFDINPVGTGETINGSSTNRATINGHEVDFGILGSLDNRLAAHDLSVSTNSRDGYIVTIEYDQSMATGLGEYMTDFIGTNANPITWTSPPGAGIESYFGYTTNDDSLLLSPANRFSGNKWAGFTTYPQEVAHENHTTENQITRIGYRLQLGNYPDPGVYSTNITYICTPTY